MTLILALAYKDGIVFASDSMASMPTVTDVATNQLVAVNYKFTKVRILGDNKLWAASGSTCIIQQFEKHLGVLQQKYPNFSFSNVNAMKELRDGYAAILGDVYLNHKRIYGIPEEAILEKDQLPKADLPSAQVIIVGYDSVVGDSETLGRIFHLDTNGQSMFWERGYGFKAIGFEFIALLFLKQFKTIEYNKELARFEAYKYSKELACFIAYKVLADAITSSPNIGGPINIWTIDKESGRQPLNETMLQNLDSTHNWWPAVADEYFQRKVAERLNSLSASQSPY